MANIGKHGRELNPAQIWFGQIRRLKIEPGARLEFLKDKKNPKAPAKPFIVFGGRVFEGFASYNTIKLPISQDPNNLPHMNQRVVRSGQFIEVHTPEGDVIEIQAPKEGENVAIVRTGLYPKENYGLVKDYLEVTQQTGGHLFPHGAFSFHKDDAQTKVIVDTSGQDASDAVGEQAVKEELDRAELALRKMGSVAARRGKEFSSRDMRYTSVFGVKDISYVVYYMPHGSALLCRDIDGTLANIYSTLAGCIIEKAGKLLDVLFDELRAQHAKLIEVELLKLEPLPLFAAADRPQDPEQPALEVTDPPALAVANDPPPPSQEKGGQRRRSRRRSRQDDTQEPAVAESATNGTGNGATLRDKLLAAGKAGTVASLHDLKRRVGEKPSPDAAPKKDGVGEDPGGTPKVVKKRAARPKTAAQEKRVTGRGVRTRTRGVRGKGSAKDPKSAAPPPA